MTLNAAIRDIPRPITMEQLLVDDRGFPVPWFVAIVDGKPDHRVVDERKLHRAVREERCWLCGGKLGRIKASVIGPMCAVNRIISEPPSHPQCAQYAVLACPFLAQPRARRNTVKALPEEGQKAAGHGLDRNPGVTVIWESLAHSKHFQALRGAPGLLFDLGAPHRVTWWREGRPATREEAMDSIASGMPSLLELAVAEGRPAVDALEKALERVKPLLPKPDLARQVA